MNKKHVLLLISISLLFLIFDLGKGLFYGHIGVGSSRSYLNTFQYWSSYTKANEGNVESIKKLRMYYEFWKNDIQERNKWLALCAELGDPDCLYSLGAYHVRFEDNWQKGAPLIREAANLNYLPAQKFIKHHPEKFNNYDHKSD
ncbi:SEL1-like repeat protein [Flocculibacter collagenilyticus]|uniref:hypothetical protein n=1 Tax=Flocculibacter collagenilyticus TaxID=2744479 RepID=UPI0018F37DA2|nr:hypothetical protein [Flocculibacter collagenilyticus]